MSTPIVLSITLKSCQKKHCTLTQIFHLHFRHGSVFLAWWDTSLAMLCRYATHLDIHLALTHLSAQSLQHHTSAKCMEGEKWQCNIPRQTWFWSRTHPRLSSLHLVVNLQASTCRRINSGRGVTVQVFSSQDFDVTKIQMTSWETPQYKHTSLHHHNIIHLWVSEQQQKYQALFQTKASRNSACWRKTWQQLSVRSSLQVATSKFRGSLSGVTACSGLQDPNSFVLFWFVLEILTSW